MGGEKQLHRGADKGSISIKTLPVEDVKNPTPLAEERKRSVWAHISEMFRIV